MPAPEHAQLDLLWAVFCALLVFSLQAGFCCLESGLVRAKNSINVAIKNVGDISLAGFLFWLIGLGVMFGDSVAGVLG